MENKNLKPIINEYIVKDILAKKELSNLDPGFVSRKVIDYLNTHPKLSKKIGTEETGRREKARGEIGRRRTGKQDFDFKRLQRAKQYKELVKNIRTGLREVYGVFIMKDYHKRQLLLQELRKNPSPDNHNKILALHKSSKERLPYYQLVYKKIFNIIMPRPKRIVDLACGLNPFSYPYLGFKPRYLACDLSAKDLEFVQEYFDSQNIPSSTLQLDLLKDDLKGLAEPGDLVLLLKTLDSLESLQRNSSKNVLKALNAPNLVVSFSTKSLGGSKNISDERRAWFDRLVKELGYKKHFFRIPNEAFYVLAR